MWPRWRGGSGRHCQMRAEGLRCHRPYQHLHSPVAKCSFWIWLLRFGTKPANQSQCGFYSLCFERLTLKNKMSNILNSRSHIRLAQLFHPAFLLNHSNEPVTLLQTKYKKFIKILPFFFFLFSPSAPQIQINVHSHLEWSATVPRLSVYT